jgi:hypothetical protein
MAKAVPAGWRGGSQVVLAGCIRTADGRGRARGQFLATAGQADTVAGRAAAPRQGCFGVSRLPDGRSQVPAAPAQASGRTAGMRTRFDRAHHSLNPWQTT